MNKVFLHGNLGADPELSAQKGKVSVCTFTLATHEIARTKAGDMVEVTEWHKIVTFGKTAEFCAEYLKKGDEAIIEGKIQSCRDGENGRKKPIFQIVARSVDSVGSKRRRQVASFSPVEAEATAD